MGTALDDLANLNLAQLDAIGVSLDGEDPYATNNTNGSNARKLSKKKKQKKQQAADQSGLQSVDGYRSLGAAAFEPDRLMTRRRDPSAKGSSKGKGKGKGKKGKGNDGDSGDNFRQKNR